MAIQADQCTIAIRKSTRHRINIHSAIEGKTTIEYLDSLVPAIPTVSNQNIQSGDTNAAKSE